jgi:hypothetical protein
MNLMERNMKEDFFQTTDLPTAAFLLTRSEITFRGLAAKDHKTKFFLFEPSQEARYLALQFVAGTATTIARQYADALRTAKDLIFQEARSQGPGRKTRTEKRK